MTQNPYSGATLPVTDPGYLAPPRTSVLAILSLISGIIALVGCCITGVPLGVLAFVLGVPALLMIGGSNGRVTGRGLAIGGIICGTVGLILQVVITIMATSGLSAFSGMISPSLVAVQSVDAAGVQKHFTQGSAAQLSEPKIKEFNAKVDPVLGKHVSTSGSLWDVIKAAMEISKDPTLSKKLGGGNQQGGIPFLTTFEKGQAVVFYEFEQSPGSQSPNIIKNIIILPKGGAPIILLDDAAPAPPGTPAPPAPPTPAKPSTP